MIDIGVNLLHEQFAQDRDAVVERAWQAGLVHMIITGTDLPSSRAAAQIVGAAAPARLSATAGIHPHHASEVPQGWRRTVEELAQQPGVVAIGETGLDFNRNFSPRPVQQRLFQEHLALAAELDLPVFVHDREAGETVAGCLREAARMESGVVVHCFTGTAEDLQRYLDLGCHIGVTGWVCDRRRGAALRELVPEIPLDRLMIESDAPFLKPHNAPKDQHGRRNEPALLPWVARQLARLYAIGEHEVAAVTAANARRFFRLDEDRGR
jgi:TatD DNase family protein